MPHPEIDQLRTIIIEAAEQELVPRFATAEHRLKADDSIVTVADISMQQRVKEQLAARWPEYDFLGEEMPEQEQRQLLNQQDTGFWCLDPLDGTSNFAAGIPFFSVSLALIIGGAPVIGLAYDPIRRECFSAQKGQGAWLNNEPLIKKQALPPLKHCIAAIDFKRLPASLARRLAESPPYRSQRSFGSVALDWCWIAASRFHVYLHGKQKLWDYAAGSLILEECDGHALTLEEEPVFAPVLAARSVFASLDGELFAAWRNWLCK